MIMIIDDFVILTCRSYVKYDNVKYFFKFINSVCRVEHI